ncbi:hypothetical protein [Sphingobium lignivorans]|uniref:Uncharacterized protein n=1 Tax=Sphingobium lignivorans TaxID=2735886 RepID=A0ABR6NFA7_9SPHN|nr:hypothetical protein [Sphingobium lignivorans]MBB5985962.1 hypothetical protein [Sphingobium lignivorans]
MGGYDITIEITSEQGVGDSIADLLRSQGYDVCHIQMRDGKALARQDISNRPRALIRETHARPRPIFLRDQGVNIIGIEQHGETETQATDAERCGAPE